MKITYTGRQVELAPAQFKKLEARFAKIGKLLDGRRECEAHVILSLERHQHSAEATINYFGHQLVGIGSNADLFNAIHAAAEKLEKQSVKARTKWRDTKRTPHKSASEVETDRPTPPETDAEPGRRVYRVNHFLKSKPMTLDEALLEMGGSREYLVYRDAATERVSVLIRRRDGNLDLVEA
jgi:putative sigma-54 modulation protein